MLEMFFLQHAVPPGAMKTLGNFGRDEGPIDAGASSSAARVAAGVIMLRRISFIFSAPL